MGHKPWLAGCTLHTQSQASTHMVTMHLNEALVMVLLDSGSTITLAQPSALPKIVQSCSRLACYLHTWRHQRGPSG